MILNKRDLATGYLYNRQGLVNPVDGSNPALHLLDNFDCRQTEDSLEEVPHASSYPAAKVLGPATSVWGLVGGSGGGTSCKLIKQVASLQ